MIRSVAVAIALAIGLGALPATAQFGFVLYDYGGDITREDLALLGDAIDEVLDSGAVDTTSDWSNPNTGLGGRATLTQVFDLEYGGNEIPWGKVYFTIDEPDLRGLPFLLNFCQRADGTWAIAP